MVKPYVLIGITIGIFFAGIGIGYLVFSNTNNPTNMMQNHQFMQKMMQDPQFHQQIMNNMNQNPQMMNKWMGTIMSNPEFMQNMHSVMMNDSQHMQQMANVIGPGIMGYMMNDSNLRQQMFGNMLEHHEFMDELMKNQQFQQNWIGPWMMNNTNWRGMMGSGMMSDIPK